VLLVTGETLRWIAALALATSVINLSVLVRTAHQRAGAASLERAG
jgi:hypothetical protein